MRSPDQRARVALLLLGVAFAAVAVGATVSRSLIPRSIDSTVHRVEVRQEKHPGVDDVWLVHLDDQGAVHVDAATARRLEKGMNLRKGAWDTNVRAGDQAIPLTLSSDARAMLWVMPLTVISAVAAGRGWHGRRS